MSRHFRIKISNSKNSRSQDIELSYFVIGRGDDADFRITTPGISRRHISVELKGDKVFVTDLGSSNGTLINGKKMTPEEPVLYNEGDMVVLGHEKIVLEFAVIGTEDVEEVEMDVGLPPIPADILSKHSIPEPTGLTKNNAPTLIEKETKLPRIPEIPLREDTIIDPKFQRVVRSPDQNDEEAKAAALKIKVAATTEAAQITQEAKERARIELYKAQEKADQILEKAAEQAAAIQQKSETDAAEMQRAMQAAIANVHAEIEKRAELTRKESREKGEVIIAEYTAKAEKILSSARVSATAIKGDAQQEADAIIGAATQKATEMRNAIEPGLKALQKETNEKATEALKNAQTEADQILTEARNASALMRRNIESEVASSKKKIEEDVLKIREQAEQEATTIVLASQRLAEDQRLALEQAKKDVEFELDDKRDQLHNEIRRIKAEAEKEANGIIRAAEREIEAREARAAIEAKELLKKAQEEASQEKISLLKAANEEVAQVKSSELKKVDELRQEMLAKMDEEKQKVSRSIARLEKEQAQVEAKLNDVNLKNAQAVLENQNLSEDTEKLAQKFQTTKAKTEQELDRLAKQVEATQSLLNNQRSEFDKIMVDTQAIRSEVSNAHKTLADIKTEREKINLEITQLKEKEEQLQKEVEIQIKQNAAEKLRLRAQVEKEVQAFKDEAMGEVKTLREKAQTDFETRKAEQAAELTKMRMTELETIKGLRGEEETKFRAARKHHTLEIAKALENFLVSRVKESLGTKDLPQSLSNFFPEVKTIVGTVLEDEFPGGLPKSDDSPAKNVKKRNMMLIAGSAALLLIILAVVPFGGDGSVRKPASEVFLERLKSKEPAKLTFSPTLTDSYKGSYTDNVLYTKDYVTFKLDPDRQARWIKDLNKYFIEDLHLNENAIVKFISIETSLVTQLHDLRNAVHVENQKEDIAKMTSLERSTVPEIVEVLGSDQKYKQFRAYEQKYFEKNRAPASETKTP